MRRHLLIATALLLAPLCLSPASQAQAQVRDDRAAAAEPVVQLAQQYRRHRNQMWSRPQMNDAYRPGYRAPGSATPPNYATQPYVPDPELQPGYDEDHRGRSVYDRPADDGYNPWRSGVAVERRDLAPVEDDGRITVALLLPLSGKAEGLGRAMLNAAQQALFDRGADEVTVLLRDTRGEAGHAAKMAQEVLEEGADLILGPLFADNARAVHAVARQQRIPMITFSNDRTIAGNGAYVMGFQPRNQVERVISYSMARGLGHAAALVSDDAYGVQLEEELTALAKLGGLKLDRPARFSPGGNADHRDAVRRAASYDARKARTEAEFGKDARIIDPEFDMILLGAGGETLRSLTPLLAYYDVDRRRVKYLGTGLWDDASLAREPDVQGGWFAAPDPASRARFESSYAASFGTRPPRLATLAYDGMALAAVLSDNPVMWGEASPFGFSSLTDESGFRGTDGLFRFRADGLVERALAVLEVTPQGPRVIDTAPESFETEEDYGSFRLPASYETELNTRY